MSARCAACLQPISGRDPFVLAGTEVFHRACSTNIAQSRATRQAQRIIDLRDQVRQLTILADHHKHLESDFEDRKRQLEREMDRLRLDRIRNAPTPALDLIALRLDRDRAIAERDAARAERDAARREAQLHQTIQGVIVAPTITPSPTTATTATPTPTPAPETAAPEAEDSTVVRFSLLELDPL